MASLRTRSVIAAGALLAATLAVAAPGSAAPSPAVEAPPSADMLVMMTNGMMRVGDVPASLASKDPWAVGYMIPPGGQDPIPLCVYSLNKAVPLSPTGAINYTSGYLGGVTQTVYSYDSPARAAAAWRAADAQLKARCSARYTVEGTTTTVTSGRLPADAAGTRGWWVRTDQSGSRGSGSYLTVTPVGDSIQMLYYFSPKPRTTAAQRSDMDSLSPVLARRLALAAKAPVTQEPLLTQAQRSMLQPADVPADLAYTLPADGGWSSFQSYQPGVGPWGCGAATMPKGVGSFQTGFGGDGGVISVPGSVDQQVEVYADRAQAEAAWAKLSASILGCAEGGTGPLSPTKTTSRTVVGTSPLVVDGTAGVWTRELQTFGNEGTCSDDTGKTVPCDTFTSKTYSISHLVGEAIQTVSYSTTVDGIRQVPLDQLSVNRLAEELALRWVDVP